MTNNAPQSRTAPSMRKVIAASRASNSTIPRGRTNEKKKIKNINTNKKKEERKQSEQQHNSAGQDEQRPVLRLRRSKQTRPGHEHRDQHQDRTDRRTRERSEVQREQSGH